MDVFFCAFRNAWESNKYNGEPMIPAPEAKEITCKMYPMQISKRNIAASWSPVSAPLLSAHYGTGSAEKLSLEFEGLVQKNIGIDTAAQQGAGLIGDPDVVDAESFTTFDLTGFGS